MVFVMALIATGRLSDRAAEATAHMSAMKVTSHSAMPTGLRSTEMGVCTWGGESSTTTTGGISVADRSGIFATAGLVGTTVGGTGEAVGRITEIQGILIVALLLEQRL